MRGHAGVLAGVAIALALAGCAAERPVLDPTAGPGEPNAIDQYCDVERDQPDGSLTYVHVTCPLNRSPSLQEAAASLQAGLGLSLVPGAVIRSSQYGRTLWRYTFLLDTGERPLRLFPVFPYEAATNSYVAGCAARFDLTPEGATTNICAACAATGAQEAFEVATRDAVALWLYEPAAGDPDAADRRNIRVEIPFETMESRTERVEAPPVPATACPAGER